MDCMVHGVEKSRTQLSNLHFQELLKVEYKIKIPSSIVTQANLAEMINLKYFNILIKTVY